MASGNKATCDLSGFLTNFAVSSPLYNGTLAWYYLVSIHQNWPDRKIRNIEKWFHIIPISFAILSSSIALGLDLYGSVDWLCWLVPAGSSDDWTNAQKHLRVFHWIFLFGPLWITIVFVTTVVVLLFRKMRENEKKMKRYARPDVNLVNNESGPAVCSTHYVGDSMQASSGYQSRNIDVSRNTASSQECTHTGGQEGWTSLKKIGVVARNNSAGGESDGWRNIKKSGVSTMKIEAEAKPVEENAPPNDEEAANAPADQVVDDGSKKTIPGSKTEGHDSVAEVGLEVKEEEVKEENSPDESDLATEDVENVVKISDGESPRNDTEVERDEEARLRDSRKTKYKRASKSRQISIQGMLFVCAFYVTWFFPTVQRITEVAANKKFFVFQFFDSFLLPLQGAINFGVYIRPRDRKSVV